MSQEQMKLKSAPGLINEQLEHRHLKKHSPHRGVGSGLGRLR